MSSRATRCYDSCLQTQRSRGSSGVLEAFETQKGNTERKPSLWKKNQVRLALFGFAAVMMLYLGVTSAFAKAKSVAMTFSGNGAFASPINLQYPNTTTIEENVAGNG